MKPTRHFKLVYKSSDTSRTLLIKGEFLCRLEWFILAASTVQAILMFWFQSKRTNREKKKVDVVLPVSQQKVDLPWLRSNINTRK